MPWPKGVSMPMEVIAKRSASRIANGLKVTRKRTPKPVEERFFRLTIPEPNSGCLLWLGSYNKDGYGQFKVHNGTRNGRTILAHRVAWELSHGLVVGDFQVLHECDTRPCVNKDHLFLGTHRDNMEARNLKGRQAFGNNHPRTKVTDEQVLEILALWEARTHKRSEIAEMYGVCAEYIGQLVSGVRRRHVWS